MSLPEKLEKRFSSLPQKPSANELKCALDDLSLSAEEVLPYANSPNGKPYGRKVLYQSPFIEVILMQWSKEQACAPHDHGDSFGWIYILSGASEHTLFKEQNGYVPEATITRIEKTGDYVFTPRKKIHQMASFQKETPLLTLHVYTPPIQNMKVYDLNKCAACTVSSDCGAWWPEEQRQKLRELKLQKADE
ncbi:hypothetical protein G4V62_03190 [Bacillaceae bacterium SIJ1]|nr:hypothetical protein [Litoribacterium kuwaitense]